MLGAAGGAAAQIARRQGARVVGLVREPPAPRDPAFALADRFIVSEGDDFPFKAWDATDDGAHVVLDCIGGDLLQPALRCLRRKGRLVSVMVGNGSKADFNMADFFHNENHLLGADALSLDLVAFATCLDRIGSWFEDGTFKPPSIARVYSLDDAPAAYATAMKSPDGWIVLGPDRET